MQSQGSFAVFCWSETVGGVGRVCKDQWANKIRRRAQSSASWKQWLSSDSQLRPEIEAEKHSCKAAVDHC